MTVNTLPESTVEPPKPAINPYDSSLDTSGVYRSVHRAAVMSLVVAGLGLSAFLAPILVILPLAAFFLGLSGYNAIRRFPDEYSGLKIALGGMWAGAAIFLGAIAMHSIEYLTEVPEGFDRVSFSELQPEGFSKQIVIPKRAVELSGKKIFIKGYIHPCVSEMGKVDEFVLVPDMGTCCFGGQPKMTDMIHVKTDAASRMAYCQRTVKLAGTFTLSKRPRSFSSLGNVLYHLDATYSR